jgi:prepilin-type N-terminal cleavage/methylation domain-containing protein
MSKRGFSIIEIAIVIAIVGLLVGAGVPAAREFNRRQTANNFHNEMIADIRNLQTSVASGERSGCTGSFLGGEISFIQSGGRVTSYQLQKVCSGGTAVVLTKVVPESVSVSTNRGVSPANIRFLPLERGTDVGLGNPFIITTAPVGANYSLSLSISQTGEIAE